MLLMGHRKIFPLFPLLVKFTIIQLCCKYQATCKLNFFKGAPVSSQIRPRPFKLVERSFYSANRTHLGNIGLTDFSFPILSLNLPLLLLARALFLKLYTEFGCWTTECFYSILRSLEHLTIALVQADIASVTTSWFSYGGWDLDLPVLLVSQTHDAI